MLHLGGGACWAPFSEISGAEREEGTFPASPLGTVLRVTPAQALWGGTCSWRSARGQAGLRARPSRQTRCRPGGLPARGLPPA